MVTQRGHSSDLPTTDSATLSESGYVSVLSGFPVGTNQLYWQSSRLYWSVLQLCSVLATSGAVLMFQSVLFGASARFPLCLPAASLAVVVRFAR